MTKDGTTTIRTHDGVIHLAKHDDGVLRPSMSTLCGIWLVIDKRLKVHYHWNQRRGYYVPKGTAETCFVCIAEGDDR